MDPNPKFTKCCVAQVQNDPEHGSYCLAYGAPVGCFQTMQEIKQRRLKWLRDSPEYSEEQLNTYFSQNGDLNVTELVQCTTPKCNSLPGDFTVDRRGERIYKCPWQKDPDDIADLFQTQQKQKSIFCYETRERDIFPPLICQNREFTSYNFCQNDRTREGRRYAHCCVTTYVEADTNRFVCKLTGLPLNYPGRCNSFLNRHISVLNALRPQALNPRVWSQCGAGDLCNEPELYNCPVVYDQNAEAAANAKANPYVPPLPPVYGEEDFSPVAQIMIIAGLLFCVVMPITVHYLRKKYLKVYEPEFVQDLYVEPEFGEGILRNNVFNKIRPGAGFFKTMLVVLQRYQLLGSGKNPSSLCEIFPRVLRRVTSGGQVVLVRGVQKVVHAAVKKLNAEKFLVEGFLALFSFCQVTASHLKCQLVKSISRGGFSIFTGMRMHCPKRVVRTGPGGLQLKSPRT